MLTAPIAKRWPADKPLPGIDDVYRQPKLEHHAASLGFRFDFIRRWLDQPRQKSVMQAGRDGFAAEVDEDFTETEWDVGAYIRLDAALRGMDTTMRRTVRIVYT